MEVACQNFGPISEFSINLDADFLLLVGENNIGKSYAISLLYSIIKTITTNELVEMTYYGKFVLDRIIARTSLSTKDDFIRLYKEEKTKNIDVTPMVRESCIEFFKALFVEPFEKSIAGTFGEISNLETRRKAGDTKITIKSTELSITIKITNGRLIIDDLKLVNNFVFRKSKQHRSPKESSGQTILYGSSNDSLSAISTIFYSGLQQFSNFIQKTSSSIIDAHYLPASRSGLYQALSAFGQIIAELSKRRTFLSQKIELPAISEPLVDYFLKLNEIKPIRRNADSKFISIAEELEKDILGGSVEFDHKTKRLFYRPYDVDLKLDLSATSSMVSEVAPIITYMKHVLPESEQRRRLHRQNRTRAEQPRGKQVIFIEEPEAHLHPKNQVLLMEAFAKIVKECDAKIIMTSHSNFIFNKVSNLIVKKSFGNSNVKASIFKKYDVGTKGFPLDIDEYGITDDNFSVVAEEIFEEKIDSIENILNQGE